MLRDSTAAASVIRSLSRRRRAFVPINRVTSLDNHKKMSLRLSYSFVHGYPMGLRYNTNSQIYGVRFRGHETSA